MKEPRMLPIPDETTLRGFIRLGNGTAVDNDVARLNAYIDKSIETLSEDMAVEPNPDMLRWQQGAVQAMRELRGMFKEGRAILAAREGHERAQIAEEKQNVHGA
jgi:hypothetical protein